MTTLLLDVAAYHAMRGIAALLQGICFAIDIVRSAYWRHVCGDEPEDRLSSFPPLPPTLTNTHMRLVGHRGASIASPENTMAAFHAAFEQCGAIEFDLRRTLDGVVVCSHDNTLQRLGSQVANATVATGLLYTPIDRLMYSAFANSIEVGSKTHGAHFSGEMVPTFEDVLHEFSKSTTTTTTTPSPGSSTTTTTSTSTNTSTGSSGNTRFNKRGRGRAEPPVPVQHPLAPMERPLLYVELKGGGLELAKSATSLVVTTGALNANVYRWIGFDLALMVEVKRLLPHHKVYHIGAILPFFGCENKAKRLIDQAAQAGLDGIDLNADEAVLTPAVVAYAHGKGLDVVAWVYPGQRESPRLYTALAAAGVDAFTSNLPPSVKAWQDLRSS